jgi:hypothetical protein
MRRKEGGAYGLLSLFLCGTVASNPVLARYFRGADSEKGKETLAAKRKKLRKHTYAVSVP